MKKNLEAKIILRSLDAFTDKSLILVNPSDLFIFYELQNYFKSLCIVSDNFTFHKKLNSENISVYDFDSINKIPHNFSTPVLFWSKVKEESWQYLSYFSQKNQSLFLVGTNKSGIRQAYKKLQELGLDVYKINSANHSQLLKIEVFNKKIPPIKSKEFNVDGLQIFTQVGVFSSGRLDKGSEFLLDYISKNPLALKTKVLDLGSGSGVLGAWLLANNQAEFVLALDSNLAAVKSTALTFAQNSLNGKAIASDIFSEINDTDFDLIITNPPFHKNFETSSLFIEEFFSEVKNRLALGGEVLMVANIFLPYAKYFTANFKNWRQVDANASYKIFWAKK